jgi:predicted RNase H-like nuclease
MNLIGIDCATKQSNIGLALASFQDGKATVRDAKVGSETKSALAIIKDWLAEGRRALLALDAPLGWPTELGRNLHAHKAGEWIDVDRDRLFSRYTDREVERRLNKRPLEVGANLIARTAHAALQLLGQLRQETKLAIPLAWDCTNITETCAIEVYPRATLEAMGIKYKWRLSAIRKVGCLAMEVAEKNLASEHGIDAVVCVLAAVDFLTGRCPAPTRREMDVAEKEGWIWVRSKAGDLSHADLGKVKHSLNNHISSSLY